MVLDRCTSKTIGTTTTQYPCNCMNVIQMAQENLINPVLARFQIDEYVNGLRPGTYSPANLPAIDPAPLPRQTPGAWPNSNGDSSYTLVCTQGVCPMPSCQQNMPDFETEYFVGGALSTADFYRSHPGCKCTKAMWKDMANASNSPDQPANIWDWMNLLTKVVKAW